MVEIIGMVAILVVVSLLIITTGLITGWLKEGGVNMFTRFCAVFWFVGSCVAGYQILNAITLTVN
jgi:hypothetical protein